MYEDKTAFTVEEVLSFASMNWLFEEATRILIEKKHNGSNPRFEDTRKRRKRRIVNNGEITRVTFIVHKLTSISHIQIINTLSIANTLNTSCQFDIHFGFGVVCRDCRLVMDVKTDKSLRWVIHNHLAKHHEDQADQVDFHFQDIKHRRRHQSMCIKAFLQRANYEEKHLFFQRVVNKSLSSVIGVSDVAKFLLTGFPTERVQGYNAKSFQDILTGSKPIKNLC